MPKLDERCHLLAKNAESLFLREMNALSPPPPPPPSLSPTVTASLPATIVTSSVPTSVAGHMMYPSPHTVMYASTPGLTDGGLAVLNAFSQGTQTMQVSHAQAQDTGDATSSRKTFSK